MLQGDSWGRGLGGSAKRPGKLHPLPARARMVAREGKAHPQKRHGPCGMAVKLATAEDRKGSGETWVAARW